MQSAGMGEGLNNRSKEAIAPLPRGEERGHDWRTCATSIGLYGIVALLSFQRIVDCHFCQYLIH
jgi:hypothetical protein